jgi:Family of unknown function (DUF6525)
MGNESQGGRAFTGKHNDYWYFDQLPPAARAALANAKFSWSSGALYNAWKRGKPGYRTGDDIAARVAEWDSMTIHRERKRRKK